MNNIVLCGFMGCGKTTVGKALAARLGLEFVDMDAFIELRAGMSVPDIFEKHGEPFFRELEAAAARELSAKSGLVIATGGGTVMNPQNVHSFKAGGVIIFLDVPPQVVEKRLAGDRTRPLLNRPDRDAALIELHAKRQPLYAAAADITVQNAENMPAALMAERVAAAVASL